MTARLTPELQALLDDLFDGSISSEDHERLQDLLKSNPEAQEAYLAYVDLQIGLRKLVNLDRSPDGLTATRPLASRDVSRTVRGWSVERFVLGVVVLLLAAVIWKLAGEPGKLPEVANQHDVPGSQVLPDSSRESDQTSDSQALVTLIQAASAEFFCRALPPVGQSLQWHEEYALTQGMIEVGFPDGAHVILEAPAVFEIASAEQLELRIGRCSVHAPDGAEGFRVETPVTKVVDLGTRFCVKVNEVGETDVQVMEGAAEIRPEGGASVGDPLRLSERQALRIGQPGQEERTLQFRPESYRKLLPDRVVKYEAESRNGRQVEALRELTVQRGHRIYTYPVDALIGISVTHFRATMNSYNIIVSPRDPSVDRLSTLDEDALLTTGILNPGGSLQPLTSDPVLPGRGVAVEETTPGMAVQFDRPVVNGPGPDVVLFEINSVVDAPQGDAFHVSPLQFAPGLHAHTIGRFDLATASPEARPIVPFVQYRFEHPPGSLDELLSFEGEPRDATLEFRALAVGIDLSDLGYVPNATVSGLFFQDAFDDDHYVDPVLIVGLPEELSNGVAP